MSLHLGEDRAELMSVVWRKDARSVIADGIVESADEVVKEICYTVDMRV